MKAIPRRATFSSATGLLVDLLCLSLLFLVVLLQLTAFLAADRSPQESDASGHLIIALRTLDFVEGRSGVRLDVGTVYPPFVHAVTALFFHCFGVSVSGAVLSLCPFILLFLLALYGTGSLLGGRAGGLAAALLGACSPLYASYLRAYLVDAPLVALVGLSYYLLLKCRGFTHRGCSLLFGAAMALGMLTKWTFLFFLAPPLLVVAAPLAARSVTVLLACLAGALQLACALVFISKTGGAPGMLPLPILHAACLAAALNIFPLWALMEAAAHYRHRLFDDREAEAVVRGRNLVTSLLLGLALTLPWYFFSAPLMVRKIVYESSNILDRGVSALNNGFFASQMFFLAPLLILPGVLLAFGRDERRGARLLTVLCFAASFAVVSLTSPVDPRYMLPVLFFGALLGGWWVGVLPRGRALALAFIVAFSLVQLLGWTRGLGAGSPAEAGGSLIRAVDVFRPRHHMPVELRNGPGPWLAEIAALHVTKAPDRTPAGYEDAFDMLTRELPASGDGRVAVVISDVRLAARYDYIEMLAFLRRTPIQMDRIILEENPTLAGTQGYRLFLLLDGDDGTTGTVRTLALRDCSAGLIKQVPARGGRLHSLFVRPGL